MLICDWNANGKCILCKFNIWKSKLMKYVYGRQEAKKDDDALISIVIEQ
jgi:hypothetical protein